MVSTELLRRFPFFAGLNKAQMDTLAKISEQFSRALQSEDIIVGTLGLGDVFGWSGLVPPFKETAGAKDLTDCKVIAIQSKELLKIFEEDYRFGFLMTQKAAQVIRDRLRDLRIETLAFIAETA